MGQIWSSQTYADNARFVADLGVPVLELLNPTAGERILDLGCGDGVLTLKLKTFGCDVLGVDASPDLLQAAQALGLETRLIDGHDLPFHHEFDAVFSNAALHWMKNPDAVIHGVWNALKTGGRFVGEFGGAGNVATIEAALHAVLRQHGIDPEPLNPWYFPTVEDYQTKLEAHGFYVNDIRLIPRPTPLPTDIRGWLVTFANPFTTAIAPTDRDTFLDQVVERLKPTLCDDSGNWTADYVRLRFSATARSMQ
jgi:SAM-dependent methyltransferase